MIQLFHLLLLLLFSRPVVSDSLQPHELQHARSHCSSPSPEVCPSSCPLELVMPSNHLILCHPLLLVPSMFSSIRAFSNESAVQSGDQNAGASASASVLSMSIQDCFPLRLADLISSLSKGLSGVFSSTTVRRHQFFGILPSLESSSHNCTWPLVPIALAIRTFVGRVMSLLTNTLFRFVIAFLPRSNRLLIHGCSHHPQWF